MCKSLLAHIHVRYQAVNKQLLIVKDQSLAPVWLHKCSNNHRLYIQCMYNLCNNYDKLAGKTVAWKQHHWTTLHAGISPNLIGTLIAEEASYIRDSIYRIYDAVFLSVSPL